jgi:hypothetical protein
VRNLALAVPCRPRSSRSTGRERLSAEDLVLLATTLSTVGLGIVAGRF